MSPKPSKKKPSSREDVIEFSAVIQEEDGSLFFEIPESLDLEGATVEVVINKFSADPKFFCALADSCSIKNVKNCADCLKKLGSEPPNGERED